MNTGPKNWYKTNAKCNDTLSTSRQSPIDIVTKDAIYNKTLPTPTFVNYDVVHVNTKLILKNNGHTVVVTPKYGPDDSKAKVIYKGMS